ncbi:MAG: hypothetical protein IKK61_04455 [Clostridia bacterium]|nr:hypothetical protein [Clostridia bacterium]
MDVRHEFSKRIDTWLSVFDESEHPLLLALLSHFYYYSEKGLRKKAKELKALQEKTWPECREPVYIPVIKDFGAGYSELFFNCFWYENGLRPYVEKNILNLLENNEIPEEIIIVDDYAGTGKTLIRTIKELISANRDVSNSQIYLLAIHMTQKAETKIRTFAEDNSLHVQILSLEQSEEAFRGGYLFETIEAEKQRRNYLEVCKRFGVKYEMGYGNIQSLVAFKYNTPNNTLGLFWQDLDGFAALFPREKKSETSLSAMQNRARKNVAVRKGPPAIYGLPSPRLAAFMVYCLAEKAGFSFEKAMTDFGFTEAQLEKMIDEMINQEYIVNESGKFVATKKLKEFLFPSRLRDVRKAYEGDLTQTTSVSEFDVQAKYIPKDF